MAGLNISRDKIGIVQSNKMKKTIVVRVDRRIQHQRYKRYMMRSKTYKVHDEENSCGIGDRVRIRETRPLSKDKYHTLIEIIERAKVQMGKSEGGELG
ncbi:30S ribosomal protein S17 [candidate division FCPU426 bacterium]|nr:30S ribosomal protein S17 [candidate division FCPU426 bacterium]